MKKNILALCLALLSQGCVTIDDKGLSMEDGTCIICINSTGSSGTAKRRVYKDNIVVGTTFTSPRDVDTTYAVIKSKFDFRGRDEFPEDSLFVLQDSYKHVKTPGSYYHIRQPVEVDFLNNEKTNPITEFELIKFGSKTKVKLHVHHRLSDDDSENIQLMKQLRDSIKARTLKALR